ncbi:D(1A) dopamine receptor-like [Mya arenaria]|uniref:D(1A) dopamine receptor-like n=1 Tax=Mya arenaria TaxID=6604 RepID=UPI0022DF5355|nr:D(1A) dopamine receptor-like [Mya arenaria]
MGDIFLTTRTSRYGNTVMSHKETDNTNGLSNVTERELLDQLNDEIKRVLTPVSVFVGIEAVVGFFGNLFVLFVFIKRYHACNFRYFVLCLALLDLISTLTTMPGEILTQQHWYKYPFPVVCKVKSFFNVFTVSGEAFCLCIIAVDRYRKVCAPFRWQIKPRQALLMCGLIYGSAFTLSLPVSFLWGIKQDVRIYNGRNVTVTICETDSYYAGSRQPFLYATSVEVLIGICLVIMLSLYVLVAKRLILGRSFAQMNRDSCLPMVSKPTTSQKNEKSGISDARNVSILEVQIGNGIAYKETEMRNMDDESDPVDVNDVCVIEAVRPEVCHIKVQHRRQENANLVNWKTYIMFVLTIIFIVTTITYMTLLALISEGILKRLNAYEKSVYFFFFRLVFINHAINPFVYGCLDPHFKQILGDMKICLRK